MIELIPAIDIIAGRCVRLSQGDYATSRTYSENPLDIAKEIESHGLRRLHVVDLDGAASSHIVNYRVLEEIASHTSLCIDFGGGIKDDKDLAIAFECGAQMATIGSLAIKEPERFLGWLEQYGSEKIILGADARKGKIAINGWKDESHEDILPFLEKYASKGIEKVICTDIERDGMLQGPATPLYRKIMAEFPECDLIASGGVGSMQDIVDLDKAGIPAVVFGKAIYEGKISLEELAEWAGNKQ